MLNATSLCNHSLIEPASQNEPNWQLSARVLEPQASADLCGIQLKHEILRCIFESNDSLVFEEDVTCPGYAGDI